MSQHEVEVSQFSSMHFLQHCSRAIRTGQSSSPCGVLAEMRPSSSHRRYASGSCWVASRSAVVLIQPFLSARTSFTILQCHRHVYLALEHANICSTAAHTSSNQVTQAAGCALLLFPFGGHEAALWLGCLPKGVDLLVAREPVNLWLVGVHLCTRKIVRSVLLVKIVAKAFCEQPPRMGLPPREGTFPPGCAAPAQAPAY